MAIEGFVHIKKRLWHHVQDFFLIILYLFKTVELFDLCTKKHKFRSTQISTVPTFPIFVCKADFNVEPRPCLCLCAVCLCLCVSLANNSSETVEVIIVKLSPVTAWDMIMHHVLIILTLTFISHTVLNISDNISANTFKLGMTVDLWMPYMSILILMTLMQGHSGSAKAKKSVLQALGN